MMTITYSLLTNETGRVSKRVILSDGVPKKIAGRAPSRGSAEVKTVASLAEFARVRAALRPDQAITFGVPKVGDCRIGTEAHLQPGEIARNRENWQWPTTPTLLALDGDYGTLSRDEIVAAVKAAIGQDVDALWTPSATGYVVDALETKVFPEGGHRIYLPIDDPSQIERVLVALIGRLVLAGHAIVRLDTIGRFHRKTIVDGCMSQPERLDYGAADVGDGLFIDRNAGKLYPGANRMIVADLVADLSADENAQVAAIYAAGETEMQGEAAKRREASGRESSVGNVLPRSHIVRLRDGDERTIADILTDDSLGDVVDAYDPVEPDYSGDPRVAKIYRVRTNGGKPSIYSHLHSGIWYDIEDSFEQLLAGFENLGAPAPRTEMVVVRAAPAASRQDHVTRIKAAVDEPSLREAAAYIRGDVSIDDMGREILAKMLADAFKSLDMPVPVAETRKLVRRVIDVSAIETPTWLNGWVWVSSIDRFARGEQLMTTRSFNVEFNRHMPRNAEGALVNYAADFAANDAGITTVEALAYLPFVTDNVVELNGRRYLNTYRHDLVPAEAEIVDPAMVSTMRNHLQNLCGNREGVWRALEWWLAHNVQRPGVKIRWAPLIKGVQGDGKTALKQMLMAAMGADNVGEAGNAEIGSGFNDWAINVAVLAVEELKVAGANRHMIVNALKPLVSNDTISVNRKGLASYKTINTTNVLAFSNYDDAIPIDSEGDRRWFVIVTPFSHRGQLPGAGMDKPYFDRLYDDVVNRNHDQVRSWLMGVDLNDGGFSPNTLPEGHDQAAMADASRTDKAKIVMEIIDEDGAWPGVSRDVCTATGIREALRSRLIEEYGLDELNLAMPRDQDWTRIMKSIGFERKRTRLAGTRNMTTVWVRAGAEEGVALLKLRGADPFDG